MTKGSGLKAIDRAIILLEKDIKKQKTKAKQSTIMLRELKKLRKIGADVV